MALVTMSILSVSADATTRSSEDVYWAVDYYQGAPSSVSQYDCVRTVGPFPNGFFINCCELTGTDPKVVVKSEALPASFTMESVDLYLVGTVSGYKNKRFELQFCAASTRTKANGYVFG